MAHYSPYRDYDEVEYRDTLRYLESHGYGWLIEALQDETVYTKNGRVKKSCVRRLVNLTPSQLDRALKEAKAILNHEEKRLP